jgi:hypothetical protein
MEQRCEGRIVTTRPPFVSETLDLAVKVAGEIDPNLTRRATVCSRARRTSKSVRPTLTRDQRRGMSRERASPSQARRQDFAVGSS